MRRSHHVLYVSGLVTYIVSILENEPITQMLGLALIFMWLLERNRR